MIYEPCLPRTSSWLFLTGNESSYKYSVLIQFWLISCDLRLKTDKTNVVKFKGTFLHVKLVFCFTCLRFYNYFSCGNLKKQFRACQTICTRSSWGSWTSIGNCKSPDVLCQAGSRGEFRNCLLRGRRTVNNGNCPGGQKASLKVTLFFFIQRMKRERTWEVVWPTFVDYMVKQHHAQDIEFS